ncbi:MAG: hypothetical protein BM562_14790 [Alphaproteobacteria bacterium MedPE-SWcel]|nr:MAG: hypothetical protein BM562_14790 [Alphaproteobacteria bacterium MedPE-SWcel]
MCTDFTIQRHLLLKTLVKYSDGALKAEIRKDMERESELMYGSINFAKSPETLDALFNRCVLDGFVGKTSSFEWKITKDGKEAIEYMERNLLPKLEAM